LGDLIVKQDRVLEDDLLPHLFPALDLGVHQPALGFLGVANPLDRRRDRRGLAE